jgi:hypothetical protein
MSAESQTSADADLAQERLSENAAPQRQRREISIGQEIAHAAHSIYPFRVREARDVLRNPELPASGYHS